MKYHKYSFKRKTRFIIIISLLLIIGFSSTSFISYVVANKALDKYIRTNTLPLTSDNIYSEIQRDILPTIAISSLMAQDTFVRDWILHGEKEPKNIIRYLSSIQNRYSMTTAFFISDKTHNYYHSSGILKKVSPESTLDSWYFNLGKLQDDFKINIDVDTANLSQTNLFVNHRILDYSGKYLGIIGVGLSSEMITDMIAFYQSRYDRQVYFIDPSGNVVLSGKLYQGATNITQTEGLSKIAPSVLAGTGGSYTYFKGDQEIFLESRFIPELNWYLQVGQNKECCY